MKHVTLPGGEVVPSLGQGTWKMGERAERRSDEIATLRAGVELGMTLIDTAEMYGDGAAETLISEALGSVRDQLFLVSKAYPQNASRSRLAGACEASLKRLGTDRLDLYLLHWRGSVPLAETAEALEALKSAGKIRHWGVSNLDTNDMEELVAAGGNGCVTDQILYNLVRRGPELDLLPWLAEHNIPVMAYSPVEQGRLSTHPALEKLQPRLAQPLCRSHFRGRCGKMVSSQSRKRVQSPMCARTARPPISFFPTLSLRHSTRHFPGHATAVHSRCFSIR